MRRRDWALPSVLAAALVVCTAPGYSQTLSIKQGFDAAWARQPESRSASLRRDAATAAVNAAQRWTPGPPALEVAAKTDQFNRNVGVREYEAGVSVPLWLPGERDSAQAAASSEVSAVDARLFAVQWRVAAEVREAYWSYQRARIEQQLAERRLANAGGLVEDVARRLRAGDLARADSHQAEGALAAAQAALAEATVARMQAARAWTLVTGAQEFPADLGTVAAERHPSETLAADTHPSFRELAAKAEFARKQQALAGIQVRSNPEVLVGGVRERDVLGERYEQSIVVGIRIPLGKSHASDAKFATASADLLEAETQLMLEETRLRTQVETARGSLNALQQAMTAAERRAVLASETRGFYEKSFRLGESDLPTRLRVELEAFEAERQAARSRLEVQAAISQLRQALGLLPE